MTQPKGFVDHIKCCNHLRVGIIILMINAHVYLVLYVDDIFTMKDLGEVAYILGIKIYRDISKSMYIDKDSMKGFLPIDTYCALDMFLIAQKIQIDTYILTICYSFSRIIIITLIGELAHIFIEDHISQIIDIEILSQ
ncbi:hypothetical protein ACJX0J_020093 [Zea mays]